MVSSSLGRDCAPSYAKYSCQGAKGIKIFVCWERTFVTIYIVTFSWNMNFNACLVSSIDDIAGVQNDYCETMAFSWIKTEQLSAGSIRASKTKI